MSDAIGLGDGRDSGKVDKEAPTQVGRALAQLAIQHIASYSPQGRGRMERLFGTLQERWPQELRLAGNAIIAEANRVIREALIPRHSLGPCRFILWEFTFMFLPMLVGVCSCAPFSARAPEGLWHWVWPPGPLYSVAVQ